MNRRFLYISVTFLIIVIFGSLYNPYHYFFGFVEITEMNQKENKYTIEISGDFGKRKTTLSKEDTVEVIEENEVREEKINYLWPHLSEGKTYHVLVEVHEKKSLFL